MSNSYELYASAILAKANSDNRVQPWKDNTAPTAVSPSEEWVEINNSNNNKLADVRTNAFPIGCGDLDVRPNAFPFDALDVRTNAFPVGSGSGCDALLDIRSNAFPIGHPGDALDVRSNAFPVGGGGVVSIQTNVFPF